MRFARSAVVAAVVAVATAGCGVGPGESSSGEATLTVTRDYGATPVLEASEQDPSASETVIRFLDREAEITTRFGGGFVHSIDGTAGEISDGRSSDWFFFVNGIESGTGGAEVNVRGGDRIWWDFRDWTDALRTPVVVGSWPEPFLQAATPEDERVPVTVDCLGGAGACKQVGDRLADAGVEVGDAGGDPALRLLVGPWERVRADPAAAQLDDGPATSGVFARFEDEDGDWNLTALDQDAREVRVLGAGSGLVAGVRLGEDPATWLITGTDATGVEAAAGLLDPDDLEQRYAVAIDAGSPVALPYREPEAG
jgi:hypothetical protein